MKITFISDTHNKHRKLTEHIAAQRPDVLCHTGDFTSDGTFAEIDAFANWCAMLLAKGYARHIVVVAGNHEIDLDETHPRTTGTQRTKIARERLLAAGVTYLQDTGTVIEGVDFFGVPWTPKFYDWAFQIRSDDQDEQVFHLGIEPDVLLTHGPPTAYHDLTSAGNIGSDALHRLVMAKRPRIHAFGHLHRHYGMTLLEPDDEGSVLLVNAAICDDENRATRLPITVTLT